MIKSNDSELFISFPDVHKDASLSIFFTNPNSYDNRIPFDFEPPRPLRLHRRGQFMVHFRPRSNAVPFAILLSVDARNAITGDHSARLSRAPQNYFASPPQGGVDGFFLSRSVHAFYADDEPSSLNRTLNITVHPMKSEAIEHWEANQRLSGYHSTPITELTINHGGNRQCEPIYEDMCTIGDWDQTRSEGFGIWLVAPQT